MNLSHTILVKLTSFRFKLVQLHPYQNGNLNMYKQLIIKRTCIYLTRELTISTYYN